jgi:hypothetical protein
LFDDTRRIVLATPFRGAPEANPERSHHRLIRVPAPFRDEANGILLFEGEAGRKLAEPATDARECSATLLGWRVRSDGRQLARACGCRKIRFACRSACSAERCSLAAHTACVCEISVRSCVSRTTFGADALVRWLLVSPAIAGE